MYSSNRISTGDFSVPVARMAYTRRHLTQKKEHKLKNQRAVLVALRQCGRIDKATKAAGVSRQSHYLWLKGMVSLQKVTVEHVHVHEGGQAIVGAVSSPRG